MTKKCGITLASIVLIIGCGIAYLAFQSSSRSDDDAWVKSASEMRIDGHGQMLAGDDLKNFLDQFQSNGFSDALLLAGSKGTLMIDGNVHEFEIADEKVVGGAQVLFVNRGLRRISMVGPRNARSLEDLMRHPENHQIEQGSSDEPITAPHLKSGNESSNSESKSRSR